MHFKILSITIFQCENSNILCYSIRLLSKLIKFTGKPQIVEKDENSVTLTWTRNNKVGASALLGYIVEMFCRNETDGWITIESRLQNTSYTKFGLIPDLNYFFFVRAENSHGISLPSPVSDPIRVGVVSFYNT